MKKNYIPVAYHAMQYAPALCIWRKEGDTEAISYGADEHTRVGYMDDAGQPKAALRWSKVYYTTTGAYVRHNNRRYYLHDFINF